MSRAAGDLPSVANLPSVVVMPTTPPLASSSSLDRCASRGVYNPLLAECRCTAGWAGRHCEIRDARPCNRGGTSELLNFEALCAGDCDEDRALCFCAGTRRFVPHQCSPAVHRRTRLPDGRPAYPALQPNGSWSMANVYFEGDPGARHNWRNLEKPPFEWLYGMQVGNPRSPARRRQAGRVVPFCSARAGERRRSGCRGGPCPAGTMGEFCEERTRSFCLRDCSARGRCDAGFCWCDNGWFGIDCSLHAEAGAAAATGTAPLPLQAVQRAPSLQALQALPSPARGRSPLRIYVYEMPSEFTTRLLQWSAYRPCTAPSGLEAAAPCIQARTPCIKVVSRLQPGVSTQ